MNDSKIYEFPPFMERAYCAVHGWLAARKDLGTYRGRPWKPKQDTLKSAAIHFDRFFAAHYAKVAFTLDNVIGQAKLLAWFQHNPHLCIIDIGCGAGVASAACVAAVVSLRNSRQLAGVPEILCIGVDPSWNALALYQQAMKAIDNETSSFGIPVRHEIVNEGVPGVTTSLHHLLRKARIQWQIPYLAHVLVAQVNIVQPLRSGLQQRQDIRRALQDRGIAPALFDQAGDEYGLSEVLTYHDLMMDVPVDHMHLLTIASNDQKEWALLLQKMQHALDIVFGNESIEKIGEGRCTLSFINPKPIFQGWPELIAR